MNAADYEASLFMRLASYFPGEPQRGMVELSEREMMAVENILRTWTGLSGIREGMGFGPYELAPDEYLELLLEWNRRRSAPKQHPLLVAADKADLSRTEYAVIKAVARGDGRVRLADAVTECEGDAVSALKRAAPKLKRHGWQLFQQGTYLRARAIE